MTRTLALCAGRNQNPSQFTNIMTLCGCSEFITVDSNPKADPHILADITSSTFINSLEPQGYDYIAFLWCPYFIWRDFGERYKYKFAMLSDYISKLRVGGSLIITNITLDYYSNSQTSLSTEVLTSYEHQEAVVTPLLDKFTEFLEENLPGTTVEHRGGYLSTGKNLQIYTMITRSY